MNVSPAGSGTLLVNGADAAEYPHTYTNIVAGTLARIIPNPEDGYVFSSWTGAYSGVETIVDITLSCDKSITANFVPGAGVIAGTAFADADGDGVRDPAETGIGGITASAFKDDGSFAASAVTNSQGGYRIAVAEPGNYSVAFAYPYGAVFSLAWYGLDIGLDSDPDPATGHTRLVAVSDLAPEVTLDAGYITAPSFPVPTDPYFPVSTDSGGGGGCFVSTLFGGRAFEK